MSKKKDKCFFDLPLLLESMAKRLKMEYHCNDKWIGKIIADMYYALWEREDE